MPRRPRSTVGERCHVDRGPHGRLPRGRDCVPWRGFVPRPLVPSVFVSARFSSSLAFLSLSSSSSSIVTSLSRDFSLPTMSSPHRKQRHGACECVQRRMRMRPTKTNGGVRAGRCRGIVLAKNRRRQVSDSPLQWYVMVTMRPWPLQTSWPCVKNEINMIW